MKIFFRKIIPVFAVLAALSLLFGFPLGAGASHFAGKDGRAYRILVHGSVDEVIAFYKEIGFWGQIPEGEKLRVPPVFLVAINRTWKQEADQMPTSLKKELFFRGLLPLILHVNECILRDRHRLQTLIAQQRKGEKLSGQDRQWLGKLAGRYRLQNKGQDPSQSDNLKDLFDELLQRVDVVPPSLALGQAAYESGYGTSRFTLTGNALFGQWTWGGKGIKPLALRKEKGNYSIAAFDWPVESVRAYMLNLNTQEAYREFRRLRSRLRAQGRQPTGLELANTLGRYSERGQDYINTLKGIIQHNGLAIADTAFLDKGQVVLAVEADTLDHKVEIEQEIEKMRENGNQEKIIRSMGFLE